MSWPVLYATFSSPAVQLFSHGPQGASYFLYEMPDFESVVRAPGGGGGASPRYGSPKSDGGGHSLASGGRRSGGLSALFDPNSEPPGCWLPSEPLSESMRTITSPAMTSTPAPAPNHSSRRRSSGGPGGASGTGSSRTGAAGRASVIRPTRPAPLPSEAAADGSAAGSGGRAAGTGGGTTTYVPSSSPRAHGDRSSWLISLTVSPNRNGRRQPAVSERGSTRLTDRRQYPGVSQRGSTPSTPGGRPRPVGPRRVRRPAGPGCSAGHLVRGHRRTTGPTPPRPPGPPR